MSQHIVYGLIFLRGKYFTFGLTNKIFKLDNVPLSVYSVHTCLYNVVHSSVTVYMFISFILSQGGGGGGGGGAL